MPAAGGAGRTSTADPVSDGPGTKHCRLEELIVETVKEAGAPHISFNPLTERVCIKEVSRVLKDARHDVPEADVRALVLEVHCDLRNAIQALQLRLVGQRRKAKGAASKGSKGKKAAAGSAASGIADMHSRDMGLNFFHALGKILYNKRFNSRGELIKVGEQCAPSRPRHLQRLLVAQYISGSILAPRRVHQITSQGRCPPLVALPTTHHPLLVFVPRQCAIAHM